MDLLSLFPPELRPQHLDRALAIAVVGGVVAWLLARAVGKALEQVDRPSYANLARRFTAFFVFGLSVVMALEQVGFDLSVFVGAAGIFTVALGFASQTSASNLISGLFLLSEGSVRLGETIKVGSVTGEIVSIDWLSVKLRTVDNSFVRVPNETLVKSEIYNYTRFPIRRIDLSVTVAFEVDVERVRVVLSDVAHAERRVLREPEPTVVATQIGQGTIDVQLSAWAPTDLVLEIRSSLVERIQRAFKEASLDVPPPRRSVLLRDVE